MSQTGLILSGILDLRTTELTAVSSCGLNTKEDIVMKKNIGSVERVIRIVAGLAILSLAIVVPQSPWAYLGIIPLATGLVGWCPPYAAFGFSTCKNCK